MGNRATANFRAVGCAHFFWDKVPCEKRKCLGCGEAWCVEAVPLLLGPCCQDDPPGPRYVYEALHD